jgi:hypothetical protein
VACVTHKFLNVLSKAIQLPIGISLQVKTNAWQCHPKVMTQKWIKFNGWCIQITYVYIHQEDGCPSVEGVGYQLPIKLFKLLLLSYRYLRYLCYMYILLGLWDMLNKYT